MGKYTYLLIIGILFISVSYHFIKKYLFDKYSNELMEYLVNDDRDNFIKLLDSTMVKFVFAPFNREYMRLNMFIMINDLNSVVEQVDLIKNMTLLAQQKLSAYRIAFQYYISIKKEAEAKHLLKTICDLVDKNNKLDNSIKYECSMEIKIVFDKDLSTLEYINKNIKDGSDPEKVSWNIKKATLLKANNKINAAIECIKEALAYTNDDDEKEIIQNLIDSKLKNL